jgi:hypothetical protein
MSRFVYFYIMKGADAKIREAVPRHLHIGKASSWTTTLADHSQIVLVASSASQRRVSMPLASLPMETRS